MEKRFVSNSSSSEQDLSEPITLSNGIQKSPVSPHILDLRKDSTEDISWEIVDEWDPTMNNILGQSNPDHNTESDSPFQDAELTPDESQMFGFGRKERVTFSEGECQRHFENAIYCKTFLPNETSVSFLSILEAVQKILEVDFFPDLERISWS